MILSLCERGSASARTRVDSSPSCGVDLGLRPRRGLPAGRTLSAVDVFADIAKNGIGESVRLLRQHNIGPGAIDAILWWKQIDVVGSAASALRGVIDYRTMG